jgi:hypothetical protein
MSTQNSAQQRRVIGRPWKRGVSGNPGGRPKEVKHVQAVARTYTVDAIETLVEIMRSREEPARARAAAAEAILDRGWGRARRRSKSLAASRSTRTSSPITPTMN